MLKKIKIIEKDMGRNYDSMVLGKYEDRIIDIDIVTFNGIIYDSKKLKIPHTNHLLEREFSRKILECLNMEKKNIIYFKKNNNFDILFSKRENEKLKLFLIVFYGLKSLL